MTSDLFNAVQPGLGPRRGLSLLHLRHVLRTADLQPRVELRRQPAGRHLRPRARKDVKPLFPPERRRGRPPRTTTKTDDDDDEKDKKGKKDEQGRRRTNEEAPSEPIVIDFDGLDAARHAGAGGSRQLRRAGGGRGPPALRQRRALLLRRRFRPPSGPSTSTPSRTARARTWSPTSAARRCPPTGRSSWSAPAAASSSTMSRRAPTGEPVSTSGLEMDLDPVAEWREVFDETWRLFRDYFYVENMHGYDWQALGTQYGALLPHVAHRSDLNYVLSEMVSELNAGHTYVSGGDFEIPDRPHGGSARRPFRTRRRRRPLPHGGHLPRPERGAEVPLAPDRGRGRCPRRRLRSRHRRPRAQRERTTPTGCSSTSTDSVTLTVNSKPESRGRPRGHFVPSVRRPRCSTSDWVLGNHGPGR